MSFIPFIRHLSHGNSQKKIVDRTKDDNNENKFTKETFTNRKGSVVPDAYDDKFPEYNKYPVKPKDGTRKFKGAETIRRMEASEND